MQKERYPLGMEDHTKILLSWVQTHRKISFPVKRTLVLVYDTHTLLWGHDPSLDVTVVMPGFIET